MVEQQFKAQADACKDALETLRKAIEMDPDNAAEYQSGIEYTENILKTSETIVKAYKVVEPTKDAERKEKDAAALAKAKEKEDTEKSAKSKGRKRKPKEAPVPVEPTPATESVEKESNADDLLSLFGD